MPIINARASRVVSILMTSLATLVAQSVNPAVTVPRTVRYTGSFRPADGSRVQSLEGVTLAVYGDQTGGNPLWQETQNVQMDASGNFTAEMGATQNGGLPLDLLSTGEPRWLGVRVNRPGEVEQPRVQMLSVPYALRASDADTLGGIPASAYLRTPAVAAPGTAPTAIAATGVASTNAVKPRITSGTANYIGMFTNATDLGNSVMFQNSGKIGLNTLAPLDNFHVAFNNSNGAFTGYAVQNLGSGAASYSGMTFYDQNGALGQFQGFNNSTHEYRINNIASGGSINFMLNSTSALQVRSDGDVDIAGSIRKAGTLFIHNLGTDSTALGLGALAANTSSGNTAVGRLVMQGTTTGNDNTAVGSGALYSNTTGTYNVAIGSQALNNSGVGSQNVAVGRQALLNSTVSQTTAVGYQAMMSNTLGIQNTAIGYQALLSNSTNFNTAVGSQALTNDTSGDGNTAVGDVALFSNTTGRVNTAIGDEALNENTTGSDNTAVGGGALQTATGSSNIGVGAAAGGFLGGGSNNIEIGNEGSTGDNAVIRLGTLGTQSAFFAAGIRGATTGASNAVTVVIDSNGQLGTISSSRRFKEDIQDMGDASSNLLRLRPVTYRYKQPYADGSKPVDYGLIAEEVAEIYPDLVATNKDGQIETVQYHKLTPMLLNEVQKQRRELQDQSEHAREQDEMIQQLQARLAALEALLSRKTPAPRLLAVKSSIGVTAFP